MGTRFSDYMAGRESERTPDEAALAEVFAAHFSSAADRMSTIGQQLAAARQARHWSQKELSEQSGIPQSEISKIEADRANPTKATIERLGAPLGLRPGLIPVPARNQPVGLPESVDVESGARTAGRTGNPV